MGKGITKGIVKDATYLADRAFINSYVGEHIGTKSASDVAIALRVLGYNVTRNAVIGVAHRKKFAMKSSNKGWRSEVPKKPKPQEVATLRHRREDGTFTPNQKKKSSDRAFIKAFVVTTTPANPVSLQDLKGSHCRWPLGEFAARPPYLFCGGPVVVGCYCMTHYQRSIGVGNKETKNGTIAA